MPCKTRFFRGRSHLATGFFSLAISAALLASLAVAPATSRAAGPESAESPAGRTSKPGKPARPESPAKGDFRKYLEASRAAEAAQLAFTEGTGTLDELLAAKQAHADAEIQYAASSAFSGGDAELHEYIVLRCEVSALTRTMAEVKKLVRQVPRDQRQQVKDELARYELTLEQSKQKFSAASKVFRTAERAKQLDYLNRRSTLVR